MLDRCKRDSHRVKEAVRAGHSKCHSCTVYIGYRMRRISQKRCQNNPSTVWGTLEHRKSVSEWGLGIEIPQCFSDDLVSVTTQG